MNEQKIFPFYNGPFCQWYPSEFTDEDGITYDCAEQYMMAQKALMFGDDETYEKIMASDSPGEQKALGRLVKGFDVESWEEDARQIVYQGNLYKFSQSGYLWCYLKDTGDKILVEASPTDTIWGVGLSEIDPRVFDKSQWLGRNWLGDCLMRVREALKEMKYRP